MLVGVFRARDDGERTAARLETLGHAALLAPVLEVVSTGAELPGGRFDGVVFTSAHGVAALAPSAVRDLAVLPCFCVGDRTAEVAAAAGFRHRFKGRADAERLVALVDTETARASRLLLVAGRDRKPAIERGLTEAGHTVLVMEAYIARAVERWPADVTATIAGGHLGAALHYSRRSAELALACAAAGDASAALLAAWQLCLSEDVAVPVRSGGARNVTVAAEPTESSLLAALTKLGAGGPQHEFRAREGRSARG